MHYRFITFGGGWDGQNITLKQLLEQVAEWHVENDRGQPKLREIRGYLTDEQIEKDSPVLHIKAGDVFLQHYLSDLFHKVEDEYVEATYEARDGEAHLFAMSNYWLGR